MAGAQVWDARQRRSLTHVCEALADSGGSSFSVACGPAGRQAAQRILKQESISPAGLLAGHYEQTARRCGEHPVVIVAQDSTALDYSSHHALEELGPLCQQQNGRGLWAHSALALTPQGEPLGLLELDIWTRELAEFGKKHQRHQRVTDDKESRKWGHTLQQVEQRLEHNGKHGGEQRPQVILVQDREADVFSFFATPRQEFTYLLVRAYQPRRVKLPAACIESAQSPSQAAAGNLLAVVAEAPLVGELAVTVSRRPGQAARPATVQVQAIRLELQPPCYGRARQVAEGWQPQTLWVLRARESQPPAGATALEWVLVTSLDCAAPAAAVQAVQYYSLRWSIEQLHYVLKSGCGVERLQQGSLHTLSNAVALLYVVAWRLLWLSRVARTEPERPAREVLEETALTVLEAAVQRPLTTVRAAVRALAKLGGHPGNPAAGEPGVKTLWRGLRRLENMIEGWTLARTFLTYDTR